MLSGRLVRTPGESGEHPCGPGSLVGAGLGCSLCLISGDGVPRLSQPCFFAPPALPSPRIPLNPWTVASPPAAALLLRPQCSSGSLALRWSVPAVPLGPAPPCLGERGPASVEPPAAGGGAWPSRSLEFGTFSAWLSALGPCSCLRGLPPPCLPVPPLPVGTGPSVLAQSPCRWGLV